MQEIKEKIRLLVDMDGTLARFHDEAQYIERMYEEGFFRDLKPFENMVEGIRLFMRQHPDTEVYVVSAKLAEDAPFCVSEKNAWLDKYLPEVDDSHRLFTDPGRSKAEYIPGGVSKNDYLLDDYNRGLNMFLYDGGSAIKCHNNINQRGLGAHGGEVGRMWMGPMVHTDDEPCLIAAGLAQEMGLSYDLDQVISGMPGIVKTAVEICKSADHASKTLENCDRFRFWDYFWDQDLSSQIGSNPLDNLRFHAGIPDAKEYVFPSMESPSGVQFCTKLQMKTVCKEFWPGETLDQAIQNHPDEFLLRIQTALREAREPIVGQVHFLDGEGKIKDTVFCHTEEKLAWVEDLAKVNGETTWVEYNVKLRSNREKAQGPEQRKCLDDLIQTAQRRPDSSDPKLPTRPQQSH